MLAMFRHTVRRFSSNCQKKRKPCKKSKSKPQMRKRGASEYIVGPSGIYPVPDGGYKLWRNMAFFLMFPMIGLVSFNTFFTEHEKKPRPPFVKLEYMYRRTKRFPWGDGTRTLFHNPHVNALPDGYEDDNEHE